MSFTKTKPAWVACKLFSYTYLAVQYLHSIQFVQIYVASSANFGVEAFEAKFSNITGICSLGK